MKTEITILFATVSIALITACGGGGSGGSETVAPVARISTFNSDCQAQNFKNCD